ncbi:MAG: D-ribose pyranase [Alcaligenaceae bacterium]|nr:D-ribose pyranase [Alcaligenaceae bacterium]
MKKNRLLNAALSQEIALLGHTDSICICDAGLPIPKEQTRIDLALMPNVPTFMDGLKAVMSEMWVEKIVLASEIKAQNPQIHVEILSLIQALSQTQKTHIAIEYCTHTEFKQLSHQSKAIVRTGECSPYANILLYSGVPF